MSCSRIRGRMSWKRFRDGMRRLRDWMMRRLRDWMRRLRDWMRRLCDWMFCCFKGPVQPENSQRAGVAEEHRAEGADVGVAVKSSPEIGNRGSQPRCRGESMRDAGYRGLQNEGSTCYLNSILQCLFMIPDFTNTILSSFRSADGPGRRSLKIKPTAKKEVSNVPHRTDSECDSLMDPVGTGNELQELFIKLRFGNSPPSTRTLMKSLGIESGKQQDVEEHFRLLLNSIPEKMEAQQLFNIQVVHSIACEKCTNKDTIPYTWLSLPVSIQKENPSVQEAVHSFLKEHRFKGENRCYCENCGSKEDAISRNYFESLPKFLVILLKRYEIYSGRFEKICTSVSVENSLTIPLEKEVAPAEYELFARCHHSGGLTSGHYTSEIKSFEDDKWYKFDDCNVKDISPQQTNSSKTAYLLMYHKKQEKRPEFLKYEELPQHVQSRIDELLKRSKSKSY